MKHALLLLLMALGGPDTPPPDAVPGAAPGSLQVPAPAPSPSALAGALAGRWVGEWAPTAGRARPVSMTFAPAGAADGLAADVTVAGVGRPRTAHRRVVVTHGAVLVGMPDGSEALLRLVEGDRLVGEVSGTSLRLARQTR